MPTVREWTETYDRLKKMLDLPCVLGFHRDTATGVHTFHASDACTIRINPDVDFRRPEHLILHEFAHHRTLLPALEKYDFEFLRVTHSVKEEALPDINYCCLGWTGGHCDHWAKHLCDMYRETGTELPYSTAFGAFADAAGIKCKLFDPPWTQFNGGK